MATYTSIPTFTAGQVLTSARMNDVKNNLDLANAQSAYALRNLIHNGSALVSQRGTSVTGKTSTGFWLVDRWGPSVGTAGTWTMTQETDGPSGTGIRTSAKLNCTTANSSLSAGSYFLYAQALEGQDVQRIMKGTASAQQLTLTFWVKSNVTGTYVVELADLTNTRQVSASYTVSASGTWEQKTVTFPADTTGVIANDANAGLQLAFWLVAGSTYSSGALATAWHTSTTTNRATGQTNLAAATSNYWQVTGVQLEVGTVSSPFEHMAFGDELRRCMRYYEQSYEYGTAVGTNTSNGIFYVYGGSDVSNSVGGNIVFQVPKRTASHTMTAYRNTGTANVWDYGRSGATTTASVNFAFLTSRNLLAYVLVGAAWVSCYTFGHWTCSAEI